MSHHEIVARHLFLFWVFLFFLFPFDDPVSVCGTKVHVHMRMFCLFVIAIIFLDSIEIFHGLLYGHFSLILYRVMSPYYC